MNLQDQVIDLEPCFSGKAIPAIPADKFPVIPVSAVVEIAKQAFNEGQCTCKCNAASVEESNKDDWLDSFTLEELRALTPQEEK